MKGLAPREMNSSIQDLPKESTYKITPEERGKNLRHQATYFEFFGCLFLRFPPYDNSRGNHDNNTTWNTLRRKERDTLYVKRCS